MNSIQKELIHKLKCIELNIGRPEDTQRTAAFAWMEIEILSAALGDLLAIIHRDGGHHTDAVGEKQSVEDAHQVWAKLMSDNERLRAALREIESLDDEPKCCGRGIGGYLSPPECCGDPERGIDRAQSIARAALEVK